MSASLGSKFLGITWYWLHGLFTGSWTRTAKNKWLLINEFDYLFGLACSFMLEKQKWKKEYEKKIEIIEKTKTPKR